MSEDAYVGLYEAKRGIIPGPGLHLLPRLIGLSGASQLLLTAGRVDPAQALQWGVVTEVLPPDRLMPRAIELAERIALNAPLSGPRHEGADPALGDRGPRPQLPPLPVDLRQGLQLRGLEGGTHRLRREARPRLAGPLTAAAPASISAISAAACPVLAVSPSGPRHPVTPNPAIGAALRGRLELALRRHRAELICLLNDHVERGQIIVLDHLLPAARSRPLCSCGDAACRARHGSCRSGRGRVVAGRAAKHGSDTRASAPGRARPDIWPRTAC